MIPDKYSSESIVYSKVTVKMSQPSFYHGPKDKLTAYTYSLRQRLAYQHYKRMLERYAGFHLGSTDALVDIGCGPGFLLQCLEEWFPKASITGLDYDTRLLAEGRGGTKQAGLLQGNAEILPFTDAKFKAVISLHLIEHLYQPEQMIREVYRILERYGIFILATPNPNGVGARLMSEKWSGWREDHVSLKAPAEWSMLLRKQGFLPLYEGTTLLTGIPIFRQFPLAVLNWGALFAFGSFRWQYGEAYIAAWCKR